MFTFPVALDFGQNDKGMVLFANERLIVPLGCWEGVGGREGQGRRTNEREREGGGMDGRRGVRGRERKG